MDVSFRTSGKVTVWATKELDYSGLAPAAVYDAQTVDMDVEIVLMPERKQFTVTLWNIGTAKEVLPVLKRGYLMAIDLGRTVGPGQVGTERVVLGNILIVKPVEEEMSSDLGWKVEGIPLTRFLSSVHVKANFPARAGNWSLKHVIETLLHIAGIGAYEVHIDASVKLRNFTADGPVLTEIQRAAMKASDNVRAWMQGSKVVVSDRFTVAHEVPEEFVLNVEPFEEPVPAPILSIVPDDEHEAGVAVNYSDSVDDTSEATQIATESPPPNNGYEMKLALSPELSHGKVIILNGRNVLERMGRIGVERQAFNVLGVRHKFSTDVNADMDTTTIRIGAREAA